MPLIDQQFPRATRDGISPVPLPENHTGVAVFPCHERYAGSGLRTLPMGDQRRRAPVCRVEPVSGPRSDKDGTFHDDGSAPWDVCRGSGRDDARRPACCPFPKAHPGQWRRAGPAACVGIRERDGVSGCPAFPSTERLVARREHLQGKHLVPRLWPDGEAVGDGMPPAVAPAGRCSRRPLPASPAVPESGRSGGIRPNAPARSDRASRPCGNSPLR